MLLTTSVRAAALLAIGLALGGCSGGGGGADGAATETPVASATSATAPATSSATSSASESAASQEQVAAGFCADRDELTVLGTQMKGGGQQAFLDQLPTFAQRTDAVQPPDALAADYATYRAGWHSVADALEGAAADDPDLATEVQAAIAANPGVEAAEERIKAWSAQNCPAASVAPTSG